MTLHSDIECFHKQNINVNFSMTYSIAVTSDCQTVALVIALKSLYYSWDRNESFSSVTSSTWDAISLTIILPCSSSRPITEVKIYTMSRLSCPRQVDIGKAFFNQRSLKDQYGKEVVMQSALFCHHKPLMSTPSQFSWAVSPSSMLKLMEMVMNHD